MDTSESALTLALLMAVLTENEKSLPLKCIWALGAVSWFVLSITRFMAE